MKDELVTLNRFLSEINEELKSIADFQITLGNPTIYADQSEDMMLKFENNARSKVDLKIVVDVTHQALKEILTIRNRKRNDYSLMIFSADITASEFDKITLSNFEEFLLAKKNDFLKYVVDKIEIIQTYLILFKAIDPAVSITYSSQTHANGIVLEFDNKSQAIPYLDAAVEYFSSPMKKDAASKKYKITIPYEKIKTNLLGTLSRRMPEDYRFRMLYRAFKKTLPNLLISIHEERPVFMSITKDLQLAETKNFDLAMTILKNLGCEFKVTQTSNREVVTVTSVGVFTFNAFEIARSLAKDMNVVNIKSLQKLYHASTLYAVLSKIVQDNVEGKWYSVFESLYKQNPKLLREGSNLASLMLSSAIKKIKSEQMNNLFFQQIILAWSVLNLLQADGEFNRAADLLSAIQHIGPILAKIIQPPYGKPDAIEIADALKEYSATLKNARPLTDDLYDELKNMADMLSACVTTQGSMPVLCDRASTQFKEILENIREAAKNYIKNKFATVKDNDKESLYALRDFLETAKDSPLVAMHYNDIKEAVATSPIANFALFSGAIKLLNTTNLKGKVDQYLEVTNSKIKALSVELK